MAGWYLVSLAANKVEQSSLLTVHACTDFGESETDKRHRSIRNHSSGVEAVEVDSHHSGLSVHITQMELYHSDIGN